MDHRHTVANRVQLIRGKRNFTRTAVYAAPRPFLFVALNVSGTARLTTHLVCQLPSNTYKLFQYLRKAERSIVHLAQT
jgi:hypothetical protein